MSQEDLDIRKISIGNDLTRHYQVGKTPNVDKITHDKDLLDKFGINQYTIWTRLSKEFVKWKIIQNIPVMIEYDLVNK